MSKKALPGRERILEQLKSVKRQLLQLAEPWRRRRRSTLHQALLEPIYQDVSTSTSLATALDYLAPQAEYVNDRLGLLRREGEPVPDDLRLDLAERLQTYLDDRRSTEAAGWALISALPHIKRWVTRASWGLILIEDRHVARIETLREAVEAQIDGLELSDDVKGWYLLTAVVAAIKETLADAPVPDAVWLDEPKEQLKSIRELADVERLLKLLANVEKVRLALLEEAAALGLRVGARQRLVTEFFAKV